MTKAEFLACESGRAYSAMMRLTGLRPVTINNYARRVSVVATTLGKLPEDLTTDDAEEFIRRAAATGISNINAATTCVALKFYVSRTLKKPWHLTQFPRVHRHRKRRSRPLTRDEILQLLDRTRPGRFRILFALIYGSGLRLGEACRLKTADVDFHSYKIYIRDGKGGRHRETVLSRSLAPDLKNYMTDRRPGEWLFPSSRTSYEAGTLFPVPKSAHAISTRSVHREFDIARGRLNFAGLVTVHSLRHSFATHLVELGMPVFSVQRLLGHRYLSTTLGYLTSMEAPVVRDFSPLDRLRNGRRELE